MTSEDPRPRIRAFIQRHVKADTLDDEADIFGSGLANSMFAMRLVLFVEQELQIAVEDEDLDLDHFRSVRAIAALVERKRNQG